MNEYDKVNIFEIVNIYMSLQEISVAVFESYRF